MSYRIINQAFKITKILNIYKCQSVRHLGISIWAIVKYLVGTGGVVSFAGNAVNNWWLIIVVV